MTIAAPAGTGRARLAPLFLISAAALAYEIALTRYFAVAKWSEYGYWVISIVMAGFAFSGVALALARDWFVRRGAFWQAALPALLVLAASAGFQLTASNPFNPLQLQNAATFGPQLWNIAGYYAALLPFFFLTGLYVSLAFTLNAGQVGRVYGYDLTGAGAGAAAVLALMFLLHPFRLVPALLLPLAASALWTQGRWRRPGLAAAAAALLAGEALLLAGKPPSVNDFKAIYAPLHTPDAAVVAATRSPRGLYQLLDDFTERVDTDVSNDAGMLGLPGPPTSFGLYRDGNRIASLPRPGRLDVGYAAAALDAAPYGLLHAPSVLLVGASGGFRVAAALALGAGRVAALEPEPVLRGALRHGLGPSPAWPADPRVTLRRAGPIAAVRAGGRYDLIDLSADFLDQAEANPHAFAAEAIAFYLGALEPDGIVSLPVSIRDFPVYALRLLATARAALLAAGVADPARHVIAYRSAWSLRILLSKAPWSAERIAALRKFCDDRSFDVSFFPGIDATALRAGLYNDLPSVSFESGEVTATGPDDAIADEAGAVLAGQPSASAGVFNLAPITFDRPFFYAVLNLSHLDTILRRLEVLPQAELAPLVNLVVLGQALLIAALVLLLPLAAPRRIAAAGIGVLRAGLYFAALGLGFLFIEIFLIEKAAFYLNDRTSAFALVLTGMLAFSGLGALGSGRFAADPGRALALSGAVIVGWCLLVVLGLQPLLLATLGLPEIARAALLLLLIAPPAVALGLPFPLGLARVARQGAGGLLPWAWALNGAFSVVATPLANLLALTAGFDRVLLAAALLYVLALASFPYARKRLSWQNVSA